MTTPAYPGLAIPGATTPGDLRVGTSTVEVTNIVKGPDGAPVVGLPAYAQLVASAPWLNDATEIANWASAVTDDTGTWSMQLYPTGDYTATGAYYRIREGANTWTISVTTGGPIHDQLMAP